MTWREFCLVTRKEAISLGIELPWNYHRCIGSLVTTRGVVSRELIESTVPLTLGVQ